jgi:hypothetical protein
MRHIYQNKFAQRTGIMALAIVASGCQSTGQGNYAGYPNPYPPYNYSYAPGTQAAPPAAPAQAAAVPGFDVAAFQDLQSTNQNLKDRLDRVEKAMLRLDRRMQLVERNELNRMGGDQQTSQAGSLQQTAMSSLGMGNVNNDDDAPAPANNRSDYRPVSSNGESLTSVMVAPAGSPPPVESIQLASRTPVSNGLPSLADVDTGTGRTLQPGTGSVAIWTVHYDNANVWPERDQLPSSREVVESLRQAAGSGVTITARGKNASSVQFRERVKALSRYLSKVSSLDSVPIAALSAPHLDDQTIEILATH